MHGMAGHIRTRTYVLACAYTARKIGKDDGGTELKLGCWCGGGEVIILADITPIQFGWVSPRFLNLDQQSGAAGSQSRTVIPLLALDLAPELSV